MNNNTFNIQDRGQFVNKIEDEIRNKLGLQVNLCNADLDAGYRPPEANYIWIKISGNPEFCTVYNHKTNENFKIFPKKETIYKIDPNDLKPNNLNLNTKKEYKINKLELKPLDKQYHSYLIRKGVKDVESNGMLLYRNNLVLPMRSLQGEIKAHQIITPEGFKFFETGSKPSGCFFLLEGNGKVYNNRILFYFCEGIATGLTIKKYIPHANIFVCMSCGNLKKVLSCLIEDWIFSTKSDFKPAFDLNRVSIIIAADNDHKTFAEIGRNPGLETADYCLNLKSDKFNRIFCVYPRFKKSDVKCSDWNDFMTKHPNMMSDFFLDHDINHVDPKVERDRRIFAKLYAEHKRYYRDMTPEDGLNLKRVKQTIIGVNSMVDDIDEIEKGEIIFDEGHFFTKTPHTRLRKIDIGLKGKIPIAIPLWGSLKNGEFDEGFGDVFNIYDASVFLSDAMICKKMGVKRISDKEYTPWSNKVVQNSVLNLFQRTKFRDKPVNVESAVEKLDRLMKYALHDEYNIKWLKNWFAAAVQNPGSPLQKAPFLIGERGCGKSTLIALAQTFLGIMKPLAIKSCQVFDEKNRFGLMPLVENVVAVFDEFEFKKQYNESIKFILGNEFIRYETKGKDFVSGRRIANIIFNGNLTPRTLAGMAPDERFIVPLVNNYTLSREDKLTVGVLCESILKDLKVNRHYEDPFLTLEENREEEEEEPLSRVYNNPTDFSNDLYLYFKDFEVNWDLITEPQAEKVISSIGQELSVDETIFIKKIIETKRLVLNRDDDFIGKEPDSLPDKIQWRENKKTVQKLNSKLTSLFLYCGYHKVRIQLESMDRSFYVHESIIKTTSLNISKGNQEMIMSFYVNKRTFDLN